MQYALTWHGQHVAQAAAQDGLRAARTFEAPQGAGEQRARAYLDDVAPTLMRHVHVRAEQTTTTVTVTVTADVLSVLSFHTVTVSEQATGPRERFAT